jgi:hypothetical protein
VLDPSLYLEAVQRLHTLCEGFAPLAPELTSLAGLGQEGLRAYYQTVVELSVMRPDIVRGAEMPISRLLYTDGGAELMFHLLAVQKPDQDLLLEPTTLNMSACARRAGISRIQIHRLLKIAEGADLLRLVDRNTVVFTPTMLQNFGWVLTVYMQVLKIAARVAKSRERNSQPPGSLSGA